MKCARVCALEEHALGDVLVPFSEERYAEHDGEGRHHCSYHLVHCHRHEVQRVIAQPDVHVEQQREHKQRQVVLPLQLHLRSVNVHVHGWETGRCRVDSGVSAGGANLERSLCLTCARGGL
jgi:hypothetical protein